MMWTIVWYGWTGKRTVAVRAELVACYME